MSIRRMNIYLPYLLLLAVVCTLSSCRHKDDPVDVSDTLRVIGMSAGVEWPDASKAGAIESESDLTNDGFVVWARWTKDDADGANADRSNYSGDYASGVNPKVFGAGGTKVYHPDWTYSPQRYWHRGTYLFAAALPASAFYATHAMKNDASVSNGISGSLDDDGKLSLGSFDLKNNQSDLMVAFTKVDNRSDSKSGTDKVSLNFEHQLSKLNFKANFDANNESTITITKVTLYGNSGTASAEFTFDDNETDGKTDGKIVAQWTPGTATTAENYFNQTTRSWSTSGSTVIEDLLVFPEECKFTLVVNYTESYAGASASASQSAQVEAEWESGKVYTYEFTMSSNTIIFGEPEVQPWSDGGKADEIPSM